MKFECTVCGKTQNCFQAYEGLIPEEEIKRNVKERGGVMMQWCPYCDKVRVHKASEDDYMEHYIIATQSDVDKQKKDWSI